jgi:putative phosphoribosyl transferase
VETRSPLAPERFGFADRFEAGRLLADALEESGALEGGTGPTVVVGLARGGMEVAAEVARALDAPLDALAVRKVGHPWEPEYGIGAVAPGGISYVRTHNGLSDDEVESAVRAAAANAATLDEQLHERRPPVPLAGATCVLVDDGLATGGTMVAAIRWARARHAERIVVAVPVGAARTVATLEHDDDDVDAVVSLLTPQEFGAVGAWYGDFHQVEDEAVAALLADPAAAAPSTTTETLVIGEARLAADLTVPDQPLGWVVFAHGSGSSRRSPRNVSVADELVERGIATMLFDLLTPTEELDRANVFDVELLAERLVQATAWLAARPDARDLPIAYFGASTGAAAALLAAARLGDSIAAVVSRGGRPDLAWKELPEVRAPTLLVVGGADRVVLDLNGDAAARLTCPHELAVVPGATHLFAEPGALEQVAKLAARWFTTHFHDARRADRGGMT